MSLPEFKWRVFIPIFLLFISYVFGVAVDLLGSFQIYLRLIVLLVILVFFLASKPRARIDISLLFIVASIFFMLLYYLNNNQIVLNFIYLTLLIFYLYTLKISQDQLLFNSLLASLVVILMFLIYFFLANIDLQVSNIAGRERYYFGFSNPNKVGIVSYSLVVLIVIYSFKKNNSLISTILYQAPFFIIMMYSDSKTAIYSTVIFYLFITLPLLIRLKKLFFLIPLMYLCMSLFIATLHENEYMNLVLSFRPEDFYNFLSTLDVLNYFIGADSDGYRVDNSYILALLSVGPISFVLISFFLYRAGRSNLDVYDLSFIVSILTYGLFEGVLLRAEFPIILYFYYLIVTSNRKKLI